MKVEGDLDWEVARAVLGTLRGLGNACTCCVGPGVGGGPGKRLLLTVSGTLGSSLLSLSPIIPPAILFPGAESLPLPRAPPSPGPTARRSTPKRPTIWLGPLSPEPTQACVRPCQGPSTPCSLLPFRAWPSHPALWEEILRSLEGELCPHTHPRVSHPSGPQPRAQEAYPA